MQKLRSVILALVLALCLSSVVFAVSTSETNLEVLGNAKSLYGDKVNGQGIQLIGVTSSDGVSIDSSGAGATFGGDVTITGDGSMAGFTATSITIDSNATTSAIAAATHYINAIIDLDGTPTTFQIMLNLP